MKTGWILTLALALTLPALAQAPASKDAAEVEATLVAMWDAVEKGDLELYGSYLHPKFTSFGESDVYLASGKEVEMRSYADYLSRAKNVRTEMHQQEVTVVGQVAWITYYWTDAGEIKGERFTSRGKSTRIFVKEDGKWLCIHGHYTAVP
jgi:ketosteroid isomerase-like protein